MIHRALLGLSPASRRGDTLDEVRKDEVRDGGVVASAAATRSSQQCILFTCL